MGEDFDAMMVLVVILVTLALVVAGLAFLICDTPSEMDGSNAGANAATAEQIRRDG